MLRTFPFEVDDVLCRGLLFHAKTLSMIFGSSMGGVCLLMVLVNAKNILIDIISTKKDHPSMVIHSQVSEFQR